MLPEGWKETTLEKYIHVKHGYAFKGEYFSNSGKYIVLTPGNFFETGGFKEQKDKIKYYSGEIPKEYILKKGDCILAMTEQGAGLLGSAAFIPNDDKFLHNQRIGLIEITDPNSVSSDFLYWLYNDPKNRLIISNEAGGTKVKHTSPKKLVDISILLPPLSEQKKIAAILSTWDRAIEETEKLLANSQQQKKALMQQLLTGKKRLPGFTGEWKTKYLGDIADIQTGSSNRQDSLTNGEYTFFDRSEDIRTSNRYLFDCEAVIVPGEGQDFVPKYFVGKFDLHQRTYAISCFQACDGKFIFYTVGYHRSHFLSQAVGSTVKSLRLPMFQKMPLKLPPLSEQRAIAAVLTTADEKLAALESDLSRLCQEKKALMQQLLTGKRRVKVD
ncbi:type I restriction-modification enzyme S subunit [Acetobacter pasteurianus NBRC 3280]|uniref:Type I restriction-modification enzyme S subunit n=1 Tax=Acetobacter pasteurianus NBRC 3278 TaxID=1226660 RepID=A0A401X338_ACEPA|nr:restriction endonuclease subunit S [Acetobacter pasteurianus]GCD58741.1 type I restriction-modification enzyme S subunit [Acetobacter pasteurianus NBRC 3277]GCD62234.1 type I restriction-modification enzyme S subunit [Acetobacter pasteurianus NBRC 3278]GCD68608.1 type I restriction-modification enzyme S subunit [Acetobacter pasteurianus NBRC 3280]